MTVINKDHGTIDEQEMMKILADHAKTVGNCIPYILMSWVKMH